VSRAVDGLVIPSPSEVEGRVWNHASPDGRRFTIRAAASLDELELCIDLQETTWGVSEREVVPRNMYVLAQALGGHVLCAWDEAGVFSGFAMAVAAHEPRPGTAAARTWMQPAGLHPGAPDEASQATETAAPEPYLHSHMVAVTAGAQRCGLGFALKFAQRDVALGSGIRTMRWTFDPLMAANAAFNIGKLGAVAVRYIPDFYGRLGSVLQGGTPTDRLLAEWDLSSDRVLAARDGRLAAARKPAARIDLSDETGVWKRTGALNHLEHAQRQLRAQFQQAFAAGQRVTGFVRQNTWGGVYLLEAC
jgi:predicted GNAT superfamily acetyltransferase